MLPETVSLPEVLGLGVTAIGAWYKARIVWRATVDLRWARRAGGPNERRGGWVNLRRSGMLALTILLVGVLWTVALFQPPPRYDWVPWVLLAVTVLLAGTAIQDWYDEAQMGGQQR